MAYFFLAESLDLIEMNKMYFLMINCFIIKYVKEIEFQNIGIDLKKGIP